MVPGRSHVCERPKEDENRYSYNAKARSGFGPPLEAKEMQMPFSLPSARTQPKFLSEIVSWVL